MGFYVGVGIVLIWLVFFLKKKYFGIKFNSGDEIDKRTKLIEDFFNRSMDEQSIILSALNF
jgi:hypothetical protein